MTVTIHTTRIIHKTIVIAAATFVCFAAGGCAVNLYSSQNTLDASAPTQSTRSSRMTAPLTPKRIRTTRSKMKPDRKVNIAREYKKDRTSLTQGKQMNRKSRDQMCGNRDRGCSAQTGRNHQTSRDRADRMNRKHADQHANCDQKHANRGQKHANREQKNANRGQKHANRDQKHANRDQKHANRDQKHANRDQKHANRGGTHTANEQRGREKQGDAGGQNQRRNRKKSDNAS